jgi:hypothetical protein
MKVLVPNSIVPEHYQNACFVSSLFLTLAFLSFITAATLSINVSIFLGVINSTVKFDELSYRVWYPSAISFYMFLVGCFSFIVGFTIGVFPQWIGDNNVIAALIVVMCVLALSVNVASTFVIRWFITRNTRPEWA